MALRFHGTKSCFWKELPDCFFNVLGICNCMVLYIWVFLFLKRLLVHCCFCFFFFIIIFFYCDRLLRRLGSGLPRPAVQDQVQPTVLCVERAQQQVGPAAPYLRITNTHTHTRTDTYSRVTRKGTALIQRITMSGTICKTWFMVQHYKWVYYPINCCSTHGWIPLEKPMAQ